MTVKDWCKRHAISPQYYALVKITLDKLTNLEAASQYNVATAGWDPRKVNGYDKLKVFYTRNQRVAVTQAR